MSIVVLTTLLMLSFLLAANGYLTNIMRRQALQMSEYALDNNAAQISANLEAITNGLVGIYISDNSFNSMQYLPKSNERLIARTTVFSRLAMLPALYPSLDMVFAYSSFSGDYLYRFVGNNSYKERERILEASRLWIQDAEQSTGRWQSYIVGEDVFLIYVYNNDDAYVGSAINIRVLLEKLFHSTNSSGDLAILLKNDQVIFGADSLPQSFSPPIESQYLEMEGKEYLAVTATIENTEYKLLLMTPESSLALSSLVKYRTVIILIGCSVVLFLGISVIMRRTFVQPVQSLVKTMNKVSKGDLQVRVQVEEDRMLEDYRIIGDAFNRAMDQAQLLTKRIYEKELEQQKLHLRNLQMQITPHFIINSLNIIHAASVARKYEIVEDMCTHLSRYFHYFMETNRDLVHLQDEAEYTENFLHIQELRFSNRFEYSISIPAFLKKALVPTMVLKTFAENSIKYAMEGQKYVRLSIRAKMISTADGALLELSIEDNGPGYPPEILRSLGGQGAPEYDTSEHTGIWNMKERMRLMYGEKACLKISERLDSGAFTQILLPLQFDKGEEDIVSDSFTG